MPDASSAGAVIERVDVSAYTIPTDRPEADGTLEWDSTTLPEKGFNVARALVGSEGTCVTVLEATVALMHSTRGRARLLFEMLQGNAIDGAWRDENVREALDLCLACKGKGECPLNVDMATYKAEFLAHYYEGRLRPREAYTLGLIHEWSALAARAPGIANPVTQTPGLRAIAKRIAAVAPKRTLPAFAPRTLRQQLAARSPAAARNGRVILDTFTNHFYPETGLSAIAVLEAAGYEVTLPPPGLCCGLPLFYYGMLGRASDRLREVLDALAPEIASGTADDRSRAVVHHGVLRRADEFLSDQRAGAPADVADFPVQRVPGAKRRSRSAEDRAQGDGARPLPSQGRARHTGRGGDARALGLEYEVLDSGCYGMAGAFGFERAHYDVSRDVGELVLLPRVQQAADDTIIVANGFSCREQIAQETGRRALHIADVMHLAMQSALATRPETGWRARRQENLARSRTRLGAGALIFANAALAAGVLWRGPRALIGWSGRA